MDRPYYVFKNSVLQARFLSAGKAKEFATQINGDVRIVKSKTPKVVWTNQGGK